MKYKHKLIDIIKNNEAIFSFYRDNNLYYRIVVDDRDFERVTYEFPIPINDVGTGTFQEYEKAILLMRWIKKAIDNETMRMI